MLINRVSTFRGSIVDHAVSTTTNGYPQEVMQLLAKEIYDEDEKKWVDFSEYAENEIQAYLVLFGGKGETRTCTQVKKVTDWDGLSFQGLNDMDLSKVGIQFRVEENTYEGKTNLQVSWIDEYDAAPGRTVKKLNADDMKALDAQYASILKNTGKKAAPTKAKPDKVTAKGVKSTQPKGPVTKKGAKDPLGPPTEETKTPAAPATPTIPELPVGICTKNEAWEAINDLKAKEVTDDQIATVWVDSVQMIAPGTEQKDITDTQWFLIREAVLAKTAIF